MAIITPTNQKINIMKKILYSIFAIALALPAMTSAATFTLSPSNGTFKPGDVFSVAIYVTPNTGEEITVAKLSSAFSADTLEVISFTQADGWMSPTSGQFDSLDNTNGTFEKMAGFPDRVTTQKQFGTVTLKAKKDGDASLSVTDDSMILDTSNTDRYTKSSGAGFTITTPKPAPKPTPKPKPVTTKDEQKTKTIKISDVQLSENNTDTATTTKEVEEGVATTTVIANVAEENNLLTGQTAAVSETTNNSFSVKTIIIGVILVVLVISAFFFFRRSK